MKHFKLETKKQSNNNIKEYYLFFEGKFLQNYDADSLDNLKLYIENMVNKFYLYDYLSSFDIKTTTEKFSHVDYKNENLISNSIETFFNIL